MLFRLSVEARCCARGIMNWRLRQPSSANVVIFTATFTRRRGKKAPYRSGKEMSGRALFEPKK